MEQKSNGALIGSIIIILILVVGGIYFWQMSVKEKSKLGTPTPNVESTTGVSDNLTDIENDLNNTNLDDLDSTI